MGAAHRAGKRTPPPCPAVFWQTEGTPPLFGRAAIAAVILDGEDGRLMRGLKSTLGSGLIDDRTSVWAVAASFREVLGRFIGHLRAAQTAAAPEIGRVVLGRPVHFVDDDPAADAAAEAVLARSPPPAAGARWPSSSNPSPPRCIMKPPPRARNWC